MTRHERAAIDEDTIMQLATNTALETELPPSALEDDAAHILVIDDEQSFRDLLNEYLTLNGYIVTLAENGFQGLDILMKDYTIKLIILDLLMPGINGVETLKKIKKLRADLPIIVISGFIDFHFPNGIEELQQEVDLILEKPFDLDELSSSCKKLLSK